MKTRMIISASFAFLFAIPVFAQDRTTVNAMSSEISDNLDLRAIASIFGDSKNLEDFEQRLNDPKMQISNLDLNDDNKVDYLRVIESVEDNTHLIVVQSVLGRDTFQDVATIEVERDRNNQVQVQVVGDVYMYGQNYIYEPVYVTTPVIYTTFWAPRYRPYCSAWYWNYYPTYYYAWNPWPVFRYRNNINIHINFNHNYNYVTTRRCTRAIVMHQPIRANYCERSYPTRSFAYRNNNYSNRYELDQTRKGNRIGSTRSDLAYNNSGNNGYAVRTNSRAESGSGVRASQSNSTTSLNSGVRTNTTSRSQENGRQGTRETSSPRIDRSNAGVKSPRNYNVNTTERTTTSVSRNENRSAGSRGTASPRSEQSSGQTSNERASASQSRSISRSTNITQNRTQKNERSSGRSNENRQGERGNRR